MDESIRSTYQEVIGLEIHIQLLTDSKSFSGDPNQYGSPPNTNVSTISLAHPGTLPKGNKKAVELAIMLGLACNCKISEISYFDRKNYFYPDLPKGYQITQDNAPICIGGQIPIHTKSGISKDILLNRIHMEEDAGKSIHKEGSETLVDLNRAGVPLVEMVTEPDIKSSEEAFSLLTEVRKLVRYLEICDGNMEEGSLRCDANISVMKKGSPELGTKVEVKNMNSVKNVQKAIEHEVERQIRILEEGGQVDSETRLFDANTGLTHGMRTKERLNDYRYFPEPDLQPVVVSQDWIDEIRKGMQVLPGELKAKFINDYGLPEYDAGVLTDQKEMALYFEEVCSHTKFKKAASNWVMINVKSYLNEHSLEWAEFPLAPEKISQLIELVEGAEINQTSASQKLFPELINSPDRNAGDLARELDLIQDNDLDSLSKIIEEVIAENPDAVERYKKGNKNLIGMFMGQVMKKSQGKADPKIANELIQKTLNS